jgi:hypothetical protein
MHPQHYVALVEIPVGQRFPVFLSLIRIPLLHHKACDYKIMQRLPKQAFW